MRIVPNASVETRALRLSIVESCHMRDQPAFVEVEGKTLRLSHLGKVLFPDDGITKAEILLYYQAVAPILIPHLRGRPITLNRDSPDQTDFPEHGTLGDKSNYKVVPRTRHCPLTHSNSPLS